MRGCLVPGRRPPPPSPALHPPSPHAPIQLTNDSPGQFYVLPAGELKRPLSLSWARGVGEGGEGGGVRVSAAALPEKRSNLNAFVRGDLVDCSRQRYKLVVSSYNELGEALQFFFLLFPTPPTPPPTALQLALPRLLHCKAAAAFSCGERRLAEWPSPSTPPRSHPVSPPTPPPLHPSPPRIQPSLISWTLQNVLLDRRAVKKKKRPSLRSFLSYCTFYPLLLDLHLHIEDEAAGCAENPASVCV